MVDGCGSAAAVWICVDLTCCIKPSMAEWRSAWRVDVNSIKFALMASLISIGWQVLVRRCNECA